VFLKVIKDLFKSANKKREKKGDYMEIKFVYNEDLNKFVEADDV